MTKIASMTPPIPRGTVIRKRVDVQPIDEAEHFFKCEACGGWIDMRDLGRDPRVAVPGPPTQNHPLPDRILLWRGEIDQAIARSRAAFAAAHELGDAYTLSHVFHLNCWLNQHLDDSTTVRERAEAAMKLTAEHGFPLWEVCAAFWYGWALAASGEVTAGSAQMRSAIAAKKGLGVVNQAPFPLGLLANIRTQAGDPTEARDLLTEALRIVDRTQERWFEAELHRLRAEALLASSPCDFAEAEASLSHALAVARDQEARFGSCASPQVSPASGAIKASAPTPATCWRRSTAPSPKASIRATSKKPPRSLLSWLSKVIDGSAFIRAVSARPKPFTRTRKLYLPMHQWLERRSGAPEEVRAPDSGFEAGTGVRDSDYLDLRLLLRVNLGRTHCEQISSGEP